MPTYILHFGWIGPKQRGTSHYLVMTLRQSTSFISAICTNRRSVLGYRVLSLRVESMTIWETNPTVIKMGTTHPKTAQNPIVADSEAIPTYQ